MELFQAIRERYSYRGAFAPEAPGEDELRRIVQAGLDAPSGKNLQTTHFVIISDPDQLARIRGVLPEYPYITTAPAFIALFFEADINPSAEQPLRFEIEDAAAATENMLLAITALGFASVWLDGMLRSEQRAERLGAVLGLPEGARVRILLPVGRAVENYPRREKKPFEDRVRFDIWQAH
jgi:nitroreductase